MENEFVPKAQRAVTHRLSFLVRKTSFYGFGAADSIEWQAFESGRVGWCTDDVPLTFEISL
jgi:hypothetical protein